MSNGRRDPTELVEHFFRREYGRLVASLSRKYGSNHIELVEDSVQNALTVALTSWALRGVPDNPGGWLRRVATNQIIDHFRKEGVAGRAHEREHSASEAPPTEAPPTDPRLENEIEDDELRLLFLCCDDRLKAIEQAMFALKTLGGLSVKEIALRYMMSEESVYKRISRIRKRLADGSLNLDSPNLQSLKMRLSGVQATLYLMFTSGYSSARVDEPIVKELCHEALRLTQLLIKHPVGAVPETWALLALMHMHTARLTSRLSEDGMLLLLEEQDRSSWEKEHIEAGFYCLTRSAEGGQFSRYHAEAAIVGEHCRAKSFEETDWEEIVQLYERLERSAPSPVHTINRAIALSEWKGPEAGLQLLGQAGLRESMVRYYVFWATLGELSRRAELFDEAVDYLSRAIESAPTEAEKKRLKKRVAAAKIRSSHPRVVL